MWPCFSHYRRAGQLLGKSPAIRTLAATSSPMYWTNAIVFAKDVVRPLTHINNLLQEFVAIDFGTAYEQCRSAYALT